MKSAKLWTDRSQSNTKEIITHTKMNPCFVFIVWI